jgi:DNA repair protein RadA/Sms
LVAGQEAASPRRVVSGLDSARAAMTAAVLEARAGLRLGQRDIYLSTVGGMRLTDPSSDLAVALAIVSSFADLCLPPSVVVIGEVGLAGDLRRVTGLDRRLAEAARLGFTTALVPPGTKTVPSGMRLTEVSTLNEAVKALLGIATRPTGTAPQVTPAKRPELRVVED